MTTDTISRQNEGEAELDPIESRIGRIELSLVKESWLPSDMRGLLSTELPQLKTLARGGAALRRLLSTQVLALALACAAYGLEPMDSETISQLRVLDLELMEADRFEKGEAKPMLNSEA